MNKTNTILEFEQEKVDFFYKSERIIKFVFKLYFLG